MQKPNKHTYQPQMKYLTIIVELCKQMQIFVYAYANYHLSCIRIVRERPLENVVNSAFWRGTPGVTVESYIIKLEEKLE